MAGSNLLLGWGVPMPLLVRSRRYDEEFWKELLGGKEKRSKEQNLPVPSLDGEGVGVLGK